MLRRPTILSKDENGILRTSMRYALHALCPVILRLCQRGRDSDRLATDISVRAEWATQSRFPCRSVALRSPKFVTCLRSRMRRAKFKRIDLPCSHVRRSHLLVVDSNLSMFEIAPARYLLFGGMLSLSATLMVGDAFSNAFIAARTRISPCSAFLFCKEPKL